MNKVFKLLGAGDGLLISFDTKKDIVTINQAYNDSKGIMGQFNKNILKRMNRELLSNFPIEKFTHSAFNNEEFGRIEMHLKFNDFLSVNIGSNNIYFEKGETIHTETLINSL